MQVCDTDSCRNEVPGGVPFPNLCKKCLGDSPIKDSGSRQEFTTGAVRDPQDGKGMFDLLPFFPIYAYCRVLEEGCKKYGRNNWRKGIPMSRYASSALRHFLEYLDGQIDEAHLWQAFWNLAALIDTRERIRVGQLPVELADIESDWLHRMMESPHDKPSIENLKELLKELRNV